MTEKSRYDLRGVSAQKTDVHRAIKDKSKGLYENAFCKILPDTLTGSSEHCMVMHTDTAGTKPSLAYLYYKETGDLSVWKDIVQDALVMNLDDMACVGITDQFMISSNIARNKSIIDASILKALIDGAYDLTDQFRGLDIHIGHAGGETADVGDIIRSLDVGFTATGRIHKDNVFVNHIKPNHVIVALSSYGQATYENNYNSGIGSNGLTSARHEVLSNLYASKYPETYNPATPKDLVYCGQHLVTDIDTQTGIAIGKLLLSPTRTYVPVLKQVFKHIDRSALSGIIHNTGGGQTKVLKFIDQIEVVKDNLIDIPPIFELIRTSSNTSYKEMFETFNMGARLEIYCTKDAAPDIILMAEQFNIKAQIIGHTKASDANKVSIHHKENTYTYTA